MNNQRYHLLRFFTKLNGFVNWFTDKRVPKIADSDLTDAVFQKQSQQWLSSLTLEEQAAGRQIIRRIAKAIKSNPKQIDLSKKFSVSKFPKKLIVQWLPHLQSANFSNHKLPSVGFINQLTHLQYLQMNNCQIKKMSSIHLTYLKYLELSDNQLSNFKNCHFKKVVCLKLNKNKIKNLKIFSGPFPSLIKLTLSNNQIKQDIGINSLLAHGIKFIDLTFNPINEKTKKRLLAYNHVCKINFSGPQSFDSHYPYNLKNMKHARPAYYNITPTMGHSRKQITHWASSEYCHYLFKQ